MTDNRAKNGKTMTAKDLEEAFKDLPKEPVEYIYVPERVAKIYDKLT